MARSFWEQLETKTINFLFEFGPRLIASVIILVIGIFAIRLLMRTLRKIMDKTHTELSVRTFIESLSIALSYAILIYIIGRQLGIAATTFLGVFGAAGIAIGLALQGSLSNFAGGLLILLFKPFKVGDEVTIGDVEGEVAEVNILYTRVSNWRGEYYTMPNGQVANNVVKNSTDETYRRVHVDLQFALDEDFDRLREIITTTMKKNSQTIQERPYQLWISKFEDYYIKTSARCWCKSDDYWGVYWSLEEEIKKALEANGIKLQVPKKEVVYREKERGD